MDRHPSIKQRPVSVTINGAVFTAMEGDSVAAALLLAGHRVTGVRPWGASRAPYCMMGQCFECLVAVDGVTAVQACLMPVREGMSISFTVENAA